MGQSQAYDVIVLGGGPAGATAALGLARKGLRALLLDRTNDDGFKVGESLPPQAGPILRRLGLLNLLEAGGHLRCYGNQSAWGSSTLTDTDFIFTPPGHGWHLDRGAFERELRQLVATAGGVVQTGSPVRAWQRTSDGHEVVVDDQRHTAPFLIDATGQARFVLRQQRIPIARLDRLVATIALFAGGPGTRDEDRRTLIEACPDSWWHTALVADRLRVVIQFTDADDAVDLETENFTKRLRATRHVAARIFDLGYTPTGQMQRKPVESSCASRVTGPDWIAVGDAAMAVDPLSSQGILNAIRTGDAAATAIRRCLDGDPTALAEYQSHIEQFFQAYLRQRAHYYALEQRWLDQPFWRRRQIEVPGQNGS